MHLRELLNTRASYATFVREERNFAAILYAELLHAPGLEAFIKLVDPALLPIDRQQVGVYFEYSHLRDMWSNVGGRPDLDCNASYRQALAALLQPPDGFFASLATTEAFNRFFLGQEGRVSANLIQMPSRWNQKEFGTWMDAFGETDTNKKDGTAFAQRCCTLKWAFNAKPDIVIHLSQTQALCVEIKFDSAESNYRVPPQGDAMPVAWGLSQTDVQRYVLETALGYDTRFVFLSRKGQPTRPMKSDDPVDGQNIQHIRWDEVRDALKGNNSIAHPDELPFARDLWSLAAAPPRKGKLR